MELVERIKVARLAAHGGEFFCPERIGGDRGPHQMAQAWLLNLRANFFAGEEVNRFGIQDGPVIGAVTGANDHGWSLAFGEILERVRTLSLTTGSAQKADIEVYRLLRARLFNSAILETRHVR